jgi:hypothetical protein
VYVSWMSTGHPFLTLNERTKLDVNGRSIGVLNERLMKRPSMVQADHPMDISTRT